MGALTLAGERRAPASGARRRQRWLLHRHSCPWSRNARGMWRGGRHTLRHLHVVHANHGDEEEMNYYQLNSPTWRAKNVVVLYSTAGWRKAPA